jgi:hypothetical protein
VKKIIKKFLMNFCLRNDIFWLFLLVIYYHCNHGSRIKKACCIDKTNGIATIMDMSETGTIIKEMRKQKPWQPLAIYRRVTSLLTNAITAWIIMQQVDIIISDLQLLKSILHIIHYN